VYLKWDQAPKLLWGGISQTHTEPTHTQSTHTGHYHNKPVCFCRYTCLGYVGGTEGRRVPSFISITTDRHKGHLVRL